MARDKERELVKAVYRSKQWSDKVNRMTDEQVVAIYLRLKQQNKIKL